MEGGLKRVQVGLAGEHSIQRGERPGCIDQHFRGLAAARQEERDLGAQHLEAGTLECVQRPCLRDCQQIQGGFGHSGVVLGLRGFQCAGRTTGGLGRQHGRLLHERRRRSQPPAGTRTSSRALQLSGGCLLSAQHRLRPVPGASVGVDPAVGDGRQHAMRAALVGQGCGRVDRRADERMTEAYPGIDLHQPGGLRGGQHLTTNPKLFGGLPEQRHVTGRVGRGYQEQQLRVGGQAAGALLEAVLHAARYAQDIGQLEPAGQLCRQCALGQLQQCQRVAACLGDDPVAHDVVERCAHRSGEQRPCILLSEAVQLELGQSGEGANITIGRVA